MSVGIESAVVAPMRNEKDHVEMVRGGSLLAYLISAGSMARAGDVLALAAQWRGRRGRLAVVVACHLEGGCVWSGGLCGCWWLDYVPWASLSFVADYVS